MYMKIVEMTCIVEIMHSVDSFVELVAIIYNNCIRGGRGSIISWNSDCLAEVFHSFPHSLPPNFRIVPDYATATTHCIISHTWFTNHHTIDAVSFEWLKASEGIIKTGQKSLKNILTPFFIHRFLCMEWITFTNLQVLTALNMQCLTK
jgi:hypothetical protein